MRHIKNSEATLGKYKSKQHALQNKHHANEVAMLTGYHNINGEYISCWCLVFIVK